MHQTIPCKPRALNVLIATFAIARRILGNGCDLEPFLEPSGPDEYRLNSDGVLAFRRVQYHVLACLPELEVVAMDVAGCSAVFDYWGAATAIVSAIEPLGDDGEWPHMEGSADVVASGITRQIEAEYRRIMGEG